MVTTWTRILHTLPTILHQRLGFQRLRLILQRFNFRLLFTLTRKRLLPRRQSPCLPPRLLQSRREGTSTRPPRHPKAARTTTARTNAATSLKRWALDSLHSNINRPWTSNPPIPLAAEPTNKSDDVEKQDRQTPYLSAEPLASQRHDQQGNVENPTQDEGLDRPWVLGQSSQWILSVQQT